MNHPYPTKLALRTEAIADRLLAEQAAATAMFCAIVVTAKTSIEALDFPLGCPARGYDVEDITALLEDWLQPLSAQRLEDAANDVAGELAEAV